MIENTADISNSEVALYCHLDGPGQPAEVVCSWGMDGPTRDQLARSREGELVDRALGAQRAVLELLHLDHDDARIQPLAVETPSAQPEAPASTRAGR